MKTLPFLAASLLACTLTLTACKDKADKPAGTAELPARTTPVSIESIAREARGFTVGAAVSARTIYVFFDPQCSHCATLWNEARPLKAQAKFVWIPVGLLNASSTPQGAALLAAPDPVAAMDAHEESMRKKAGGITASGELDTLKKAVELNTKLLDRYQFNSVPTIIGKNAISGDVVIKEGALPTAQLAEAFGLKPPVK
ncbi:MAG: thioredoxin fold domain-containing protein [Bdellovibrionales bacterium]|nr:thioredoxin fold domain-containing protein [Ramlibacter sp.]